MNQIELAPYLIFGGNAREAMEFYRQTLGGNLDIKTFADFKMPTSEAYQNNVMHARLESDGMVIMASDGKEGESPTAGDSVSLSLSGASDMENRLTQVFDALANGGQVTLPLSDQAWNATFGMCTDKFGIHWMVNIDRGPAA